ncbi:recombinase family protein [Bacillus sp. J37]|uniref:recombinase family protein n=1 Tax=Bacillus sp. J37 TaxID=935837 RepID=UPI00047D7F6F|nr:recombinase family protein [Bacillus sp. J37]
MSRNKISKKRRRAYGYVRKSPNKYIDNTSIEKQIEEIEKYCELNDIELVEIYTDDLKSAKSFEGRDGFKEMYNNVLRSKDDVDYIIVFKQDRISRDTLDTLYIMKRLNSLNKHLISIADNVNTEDPSAKILVHVLALVAELEREFINMRTSSGMEKKANEGHFLGGIVFGYKTQNKELIIVPEEAKIVKYIFEKYAVEQWGYKKIASNLNLQGVRTKNNKYWSINAVKTVLENQLYIGNTKWKGKYQKGIHTPIIDLPLWGKAQEVMKTRSYIQEKIHPGSFPLSGLLKCPECGSSMVQGNSSVKYKYYQCSKNKNSGKVACSSNLVKKEYAEEVVLNELISFLQGFNLSPYIESATKSLLSFELEPVYKEVERIENQIELSKKRMNTVIDLMDDPTASLDKELLKNKLLSHQEELNKNNIVLEELTKQINFKESHTSSDIITFCVKRFSDFYEILPNEERKLLLNHIIKEVHVLKGDSTKDRKIKDIIYNFNQNDLSLD